MKNKLFFGLLSLFSLILILNISTVLAAESSPCSPTIKLVSQDPNPAVPNDYVKVIFEISDMGNCNGFAVRLNPEYPFSLDSNATAVQVIETNPYSSGYKTAWVVPYKIRVDSAAFDGDYNLKLQHHEGSSEFFNSYFEEGFNLSVKDSRTEFDAVIQEVSGSDISIAIANTGKYTANSVVVRIPEQEFFSVGGTDGQMVGNLESGDYTIVGFTVSRKTASSWGLQNISRGNLSASPVPQNVSSGSRDKLKFDIYYTDNIGERRVVNMELRLNTETGNSSMMRVNNFSREATGSTSSSSNWYKWILVLVILVVAYILYRKYPKQIKMSLAKIIGLPKGENRHNSSERVPDWIKNTREKEKK
jgi:hypothetical protein